MEDLVSVIMSTYNEKVDWVRASIESIAFQTHKKIEFIIVLDNPNNFELEELVSSFEKEISFIQIVRNDKNMGLVASLNKALKLCNGKYIARMDADDISDKYRLEKQIKFINDNHVDFTYSGVNTINEEGEVIFSQDYSKLSHIEVSSRLKYKNITNHPTWFVRKEVYDSLNGYRNIPYCEDYDFVLRAISKGYKVMQMDENVLQYRVRKDGVSRTYSLEQYLNSSVISKMYKNSLLENNKLVFAAVQKNRSISVKEKSDRFSKAERLFLKGNFLYRKKSHYSGLIYMLLSNFHSIYFMRSNLDRIRYKYAVR